MLIKKIEMKTKLHFVVAAIVLVSLLLAGTGCTSKMKKAYHESRAEKFFKAGNFDSAEVEYLRVLRADNENTKAFTRLAEIYFQQGRFQTAAPFLMRAVTYATNDLELRLKLGQVQAAAGLNKEAQATANFILDRDPQQPLAPLLLAQSTLTPDIHVAKARLQKLVSAGDRAAYQVALGILAFREGDTKVAEAAFKRAISLDAKSPDAMASLASVQALQNDLPGAEASFKAAAALSPIRSTHRMVYARFKMQMGDLEGAQKILDEVVKAAPDYVPALLGQAEIALGMKKTEDCVALLGNALARDPDNFEGLLLQSRVKYSQGDLPGCILVLERMSKIYPLSAGVHFQLGAAHYASGDDSKATVSLARALDLDVNHPESILLLAQIQIKNRNPDPAIVSLTKLLQRQPKFTQAQLLLADAHRQRGRINDALAIYLALEKAEPTNSQIPLLAGAAQMQLGQMAPARAAFERALKIAPDNLPALEQLVNLDLAEKKYPAAMQRVQTQLSAKPGQIELKLLAAKVYLAQEKRAEAENILLAASTENPKSEAPCLLLAQLYIDAKENDKAIRQLETGLERNPRNISVLMFLASVHETAKDYKSAAANYEKTLEISPKFSPALNNLAYLYSEYLNQLDRAYELAQRARELLPYDPSAADTLGWVCFKRGLYPTALALLRESAAKLPNQPEILFHAGMAAYTTGFEDEARGFFQQALQLSKEFRGFDECQSSLAILQINAATADAAARELLVKRVSVNPLDAAAQKRLAVIYQREGNSDKAIASHEAILKTDPKNLAALNGLTRLWEPKDAAKAYAFAKSAYTVAAADLSTAYDYGRLAYRNGDFKQADSILSQVSAAQPANASLQFNAARAAYAVGKISISQEKLRAAKAAGLSAEENAEAARMDELISCANEPKATPDVAKRVADILQAEPDYVPALMVQAGIKESAGDMAAAAAACEKILARFPDFTPAQRELAIVYSRDPNRAKEAYALALKARAVYPSDLQLPKVIGISHFHQGDFARASSVLKDCAVKLPEDAEVFYFLGAAQFKANQRVAAKASLQKAISLKLSGETLSAAQQMLAEIK